MRRICLLLLLLLVPALPALAEEPVQPEGVQFFIERIDVRNVDRVSPHVVVVESRLETMHRYTEHELREASDRVNRLPYLLSADFSLEKGSDRGRYVLIITLNETRIFFFGIDARVFLHKPDSDFANAPDVVVGMPTGPENEPGAGEAALGWRFFFGRRSAIHFGIESFGGSEDYVVDYSAFAVGWTQYDLFGTRAFATLNIKRPIEDGAKISPQLVVGMPITPRQTVTLSYDDFETSVKRTYHPYLFLAHYQRGVSQRLLKATWSYNTTNSPVMPTKGLAVTATPIAVWSDNNFASSMPPDLPGIHGWTNHLRTLGLGGTGRRYWEFSERNSASAGLELGCARSHQDVTWDVKSIDFPFAHAQSFTQNYAAVLVSAAHSFRSHEQVAQSGDSSLEGVLQLRSRPNLVDSLYHSLPVDYARGQVSLAWVRRNAWGSFRLGLGYLW